MNNFLPFLLICAGLLPSPGSQQADSPGRDITTQVTTVYSGQRTITCYREADTSYVLRDMTKGGGIITLHGDALGSRDYHSVSARWEMRGADAFALDAHFGVCETYRFYRSVLHRNSLDDQGMAIYSYVNDPADPNNAVWDGEAMHFGINLRTGKPVCSLDVTGHELTHAVIGFTCKLASQGESGAIGESICDIIGKSIEQWSKKTTATWVIGSDPGLDLRDMAAPHHYHQPETYGDPGYWYTGRNPEIERHINSGVGNRMFYLLLNGVADERPMPLIDAVRIIYSSFTKHLGRYARYSDWREACLKAAAEQFGAASPQYRTVAAAWTAVGVENKTSNNKSTIK